MRFDLATLTNDVELDVGFFIEPKTGAWRLGNERQTLRKGNLMKNPPGRFSCEIDQYRLGLATGFLTIPRRRLAEYGGFSGLIGGKPVPELDDLIMPAIKTPVAHLFLEVPGVGPCGILRVGLSGSDDVSFTLVTSGEGPEKSGEMDPEMDLSGFFAWCEMEFRLPPES